MSSSKQKRQKIKLTRTERKAESERIELLVALKKGTIIAVDRSKVFSRSVLPKIPELLPGHLVHLQGLRRAGGMDCQAAAAVV